MSDFDATSALHTIQARITTACKAARRAADSVQLMAVSKTQDAARIQALIDAGQNYFGENRVQEAEGKWPALRATSPQARVSLIGPLQTNKVSEAVALFDAIHTLDRPRLAEKLAAEMERQSRHLPCFVQVNTGREDQKAGVDPSEADTFIAQCRALGLNVVGLMCIPPVNEQAAIHFAFLREIAARNDIAQLSMGMSDDFETAIAFGATHVRVGSAIFGARG